MLPYLIVAAVTALVSFAATPLARRASLRFGWIDEPNDRKVHPKPTPTLGGAAIVVAVVVGMGVAFLMPQFREIFRLSSEPLAAVIGAVVIFLVGAYDDVRHSSVLGKLTWQIIGAALLVLMGVQLLYFWVPGQGILTLSSDLAVPLSILWMVAMMNAINFIDGLDGLAAGLVAIAAISFFLFVYRGPDLFAGTSPAALICAVTAGACLGFLPWNFNPAKIFMGDSGAMPLGLLLAVATIAGVGRNPFPPSGGDVAAFSIPILLPLLVLAIPFLDVALAVL
ncbi:MAG: MraY family glycosyltransferase, partial [Actinomycetota bacterium]